MEEDKEVLTILEYDKFGDELLTWSFKSKLKLGPLRGVESLIIIGSSSNSTL